MLDIFLFGEDSLFMDGMRFLSWYGTSGHHNENGRNGHSEYFLHMHNTLQQGNWRACFHGCLWALKNSTMASAAQGALGDTASTKPRLKPFPAWTLLRAAESRPLLRLYQLSYPACEACTPHIDVGVVWPAML